MDTCDKCKRPLCEHAVFRKQLNLVRRDGDAWLKRCLEKNQGICDVRTNYLDGDLLIRYNPELMNPEMLDHAIESPGHILNYSYWRWLRIFVRTHIRYVLVGTAVVLTLFSWILRFKNGAAYQFPSAFDNISGLPLLYLLLNFPAVMIGLTPPLRGLRQITEEGRSNINILAIIAGSGAIATGYWLEASTFLLAMLLAEIINDFTGRRTAGHITVAAVACAKNAFVIEDGSSRKIPVHQVLPGQLIDVKQGMIVPVDGFIRRGSGHLNEAPITGESAFAEKSAGDRVFAGTILEDGAIVLEATTTGRDSKLGNIIQLLEKTESAPRSSLNTAVDALSGYLALCIVCYAVGYYLLLRYVQQVPAATALETGVALLFAACPVALVFCTPSAIHSGFKTAAAHGVLFKNEHAVEQLAKAKTMLLDKTGTLTYARPVVYDIRTFGGYNLEKVVAAAAAVESNSFHPLALAICEYAAGRNIQPESLVEFIEEQEPGVAAARIRGKLCKVGAIWMIKRTTPLPPPVAAWLDDTVPQGLATVLVLAEDQVIGGIRFTDKIRPEANEVITEIRKRGVKRVVMVSGDSQGAVKRVASQLPLDAFHAECLPEMKLHLLAGAREKYAPVAMLGDGINDAPVIAAADVGIAIAGTGADAAVAAADIVLTGNSLHELALSFRIVRRILTVIRVNLFLAVLSSIVIVGLISTGLINIMGATWCYTLFTLFIIGNSYLLAGRYHRLPAAAAASAPPSD